MRMRPLRVDDVYSLQSAPKIYTPMLVGSMETFLVRDFARLQSPPRHRAYGNTWTDHDGFRSEVAERVKIFGATREEWHRD